MSPTYFIQKLANFFATRVFRGFPTILLIAAPAIRSMRGDHRWQYRVPGAGTGSAVRDPRQQQTLRSETT